MAKRVADSGMLERLQLSRRSWMSTAFSRCLTPFPHEAARIGAGGGGGHAGGENAGPSAASACGSVPDAARCSQHNNNGPDRDEQTTGQHARAVGARTAVAAAQGGGTAGHRDDGEPRRSMTSVETLGVATLVIGPHIFYNTTFYRAAFVSEPRKKRGREDADDKSNDRGHGDGGDGVAVAPHEASQACDPDMEVGPGLDLARRRLVVRDQSPSSVRGTRAASPAYDLFDQEYAPSGLRLFGGDAELGPPIGTLAGSDTAAGIHSLMMAHGPSSMGLLGHGDLAGLVDSKTVGTPVLTHTPPMAPPMASEGMRRYMPPEMSAAQHHFDGIPRGLGLVSVPGCVAPGDITQHAATPVRFHPPPPPSMPQQSISAYSGSMFSMGPAPLPHHMLYARYNRHNTEYGPPPPHRQHQQQHFGTCNGSASYAHSSAASALPRAAIPPYQRAYDHDHAGFYGHAHEGDYTHQQHHASHVHPGTLDPRSMHPYHFAPNEYVRAPSTFGSLTGTDPRQHSWQSQYGTLSCQNDSKASACSISETLNRTPFGSAHHMNAETPQVSAAAANTPALAIQLTPSRPADTPQITQSTPGAAFEVTPAAHAEPTHADPALDSNATRTARADTSSSREPRSIFDVLFEFAECPGLRWVVPKNTLFEVHGDAAPFSITMAAHLPYKHQGILMRIDGASDAIVQALTTTLHDTRISMRFMLKKMSFFALARPREGRTTIQRYIYGADLDAAEEGAAVHFTRGAAARKDSARTKPVSKPGRKAVAKDPAKQPSAVAPKKRRVPIKQAPDVHLLGQALVLPPPQAAPIHPGQEQGRASGHSHGAVHLGHAPSAESV
ncbi:hypothetical protein HK105_206672 [Polyrhizophydium stewartii]|uniref:Uncharacterized protein n=1 Tax=Polyrhizophydium stewartii TaxID=2732419 RepID=A0ABR4N2L0_9FUNG